MYLFALDKELEFLITRSLNYDENVAYTRQGSVKVEILIQQRPINTKQNYFNKIIKYLKNIYLLWLKYYESDLEKMFEVDQYRLVERRRRIRRYYMALSQTEQIRDIPQFWVSSLAFVGESILIGMINLRNCSNWYMWMEIQFQQIVQEEEHFDNEQYQLKFIMEFEKQLYRIHKRILFGPLIRKIFTAGAYLFSILTFLGLIFLFLLQFREQYKYFLEQDHIEYFSNETIYIFNVTDSQLSEKNESYLSMKFTINKTFLYMTNEFQQKYNFTVETHLIDIDYYMKGFNTFLCLASDLETMFIIDFLDTYQDNDIQLMNQNTNETWSWNVQQFQRKNVVAYDERIYKTITELIKCFLGIFLQSIVASIYMKMSIICAPILIIYMMSCMQICQNQDIQAQALIEAFPWVGQYLTILNRNHKLKKELLNSFIQMLILFYLVYFLQFSGYSSSFQLFAKSYPRGLSENFFSSFLLNEFVSIIFLRTRASLYFVPKYMVLTYLLFIYYFESTLYGYYNLAFQICIFSQFAIISFFVLNFEIAALDWPTDSPYTPSLDRPRVYYCPLFNMNWVNDIPTLWTMFFPLCGRRYFQIQNLALVDKNYILLNNLLNQEELLAIEGDPPAQVPNLLVQEELPQQQQAENQPQPQDGQINQQFVINVDNILGNDQPQQQNQLL